jgi:hypothetical protein
MPMSFQDSIVCLALPRPLGLAARSPFGLGCNITALRASETILVRIERFNVAFQVLEDAVIKARRAEMLQPRSKGERQRAREAWVKPNKRLSPERTA